MQGTATDLDLDLEAGSQSPTGYGRPMLLQETHSVDLHSVSPTDTTMRIGLVSWTT